MPEIGGEALVRALRKARPTLKVLGITSHTLEEGDWEALEDAGLLGLVHKPSDAEELARAVRRALDVA